MAVRLPIGTITEPITIQFQNATLVLGFLVAGLCHSRSPPLYVHSLAFSDSLFAVLQASQPHSAIDLAPLPRYFALTITAPLNPYREAVIPPPPDSLMFTRASLFHSLLSS
ncbi:hypothetical protein Hanom_Chr03g00248371 [Helianthus anomalus]